LDAGVGQLRMPIRTGVSAGLDAGILTEGWRGKGLRGVSPYRAPSLFRKSAMGMFQAQEKTAVKGEFPPGREEQ
jgi:hypothetical protein